jgi:hypothetical protein
VFDADPTPYSSSSEACANGAPPYTSFYHNGIGGYPSVYDFIFTDALCTIYFDGAFGWYYVDSTCVIQVATTGQVLNVVDCSITTTTTTTTIPTWYYEVVECGTASPTFIVSQQSFTELIVGNVVKCDDGICYTITATGESAPADHVILFVYATCLDCQGVTTTTTSTTTTTTTSTTTTTTTTTTTLPPLTKLTTRSGSSSTVCSGTLGEFFVDGPLGVYGNSIYIYSSGYSLAPAAYYLNTITGVAYEWDGTNWTGNSVTCS